MHRGASSKFTSCHVPIQVCVQVCGETTEQLQQHLFSNVILKLVLDQMCLKLRLLAIFRHKQPMEQKSSGALACFDFSGIDESVCLRCWRLHAFILFG